MENKPGCDVEQCCVYQNKPSGDGERIVGQNKPVMGSNLRIRTSLAARGSNFVNQNKPGCDVEQFCVYQNKPSGDGEKIVGQNKPVMGSNLRIRTSLAARGSNFAYQNKPGCDVEQFV